MSQIPAYDTIRYEIADRVLTLTLDRPEELNSFTVQMADELEHAFRRASTDDEVGAIVVTGEGRAFCAGMDLTKEGNVFGLDEDAAPTLDDMQHRMTEPGIQVGVRDTGGRVALAIYDCLKPVIGAINGAAVGIGATMTLPMDVRLASTKARIGFVFGRLGITPEATSTWFLPASSACRPRWSGSIRPTSSTHGPHWRVGCCARCTNRRSCSMPPTRWPTHSSMTAHPWRSP